VLKGDFPLACAQTKAAGQAPTRLATLVPARRPQVAHRPRLNHASVAAWQTTTPRPLNLGQEKAVQIICGAFRLR